MVKIDLQSKNTALSQLGNLKNDILFNIFVNYFMLETGLNNVHRMIKFNMTPEHFMEITK